MLFLVISCDCNFHLGDVPIFNSLSLDLFSHERRVWRCVVDEGHLFHAIDIYKLKHAPAAIAAKSNSVPLIKNYTSREWRYGCGCFDCLKFYAISAVKAPVQAIYSRRIQFGLDQSW